MDIKSLLQRIEPVDKNAAKDCIKRLNNIAKPIGSLGKFEELLSRIAALTNTADIDISRKAVTVFCADNGVIAHGVTAHGHEVTTAIAKLIAEEKACVSVMAKSCGADVFAVDIGMIDTVEGVRDNKLMHGTNDFTKEPAMSRKTAEKAVETGINMVRELKDREYNIIATGEVGMGNTTTSAAVCAVLTKRPICDVTGYGAGLDDVGLLRKISVIEQGVTVNKPDSSDPIDVLHKIGGLDIAALTGVYLGGALYRVSIVMDGFISAAAALVAVRLCPMVSDYIIPSHESHEPGMRCILDELEFFPIIGGEMRLGEGTGAVMLFPLLDMAVDAYNNAATYDDI